MFESYLLLGYDPTSLDNLLVFAVSRESSSRLFKDQNVPEKMRRVAEERAFHPHTHTHAQTQNLAIRSLCKFFISEPTGSIYI
jgi:hypothetical protein